MPNTVSSRSVGPEPPISTTAGSWPVADGDLVSVPARMNPVAGMETRSSPGMENAAVRVPAEAMSSRASSSICDGMLRRRRPPLPSTHTVMSSSGAGGGFTTFSDRRVAGMVSRGVSIVSLAVSAMRIGTSIWGAM